MTEERLERKIGFYRAIGIPRFRRLIMRLEAARHRKDGGRNVNYHIRNASPEETVRYGAFLSYHLLLHLSGLFFAALYFALRAGVFSGDLYLLPLDALVAAAAVVHVLCVMLQRYAYLLSLRHLQRYRRSVSAKAERIKAVMDSIYADNGLMSADARRFDARRLGRIRDAVASQTDAALEPGDADALRRLASCLREAGFTLPFGRDDRADSAAGEEKKITEIVSGRRGPIGPYSLTEMKAERAHKTLGHRPTLLSPCALVCADADAFSAAGELMAPSGVKRLGEFLDAALLCMEGGTSR